MAVRILVDRKSSYAAFYDATTGVAFGPVFGDGPGDLCPEEAAEAFLRYVEDDLGQRDIRSLDPQTLASIYARWLAGERGREVSA